MTKRILCLAILFFLISTALKAEIKVASVLGSNMVLQRNSEVKLWGTAVKEEILTIEAGWSKQKYKVTCNAEGKWETKIRTIEAGGPYKISISTVKERVVLANILLGDVWICSGQSNMEMPVAGFHNQPVIGANDFLVEADNNQIRLFTVKKASTDIPMDTCTGSWTEATAESVNQFSAVGYLYAKLLQQKLKIPVGIICSSWGGSRIEAWIAEDVIRKYPEPFRQATQEKTPPNNKASHLYNGMIAPLLNFTIKGVIWYQGESNIANYHDYPSLMLAMVTDWRQYWGEFPFYYVQIAPYGNIIINSAFQREEQLKALDMIPNSGMACTLDVGEEKCIHPAEKLTVAKRLAYCAFAGTYGYKGIECKPVKYKSMEVKDTIAVVSFDNIGIGLNIRGGSVNCFEIAGADSIFHPATIALSYGTVQAWSSEVKNPVAVRYAFCKFPKTNGFLYDMYGLPVPSFRSDNWNK